MEALLKQLEKLEVTESLSVIDDALAKAPAEQRELLTIYKFAILISQGKFNEALALSSEFKDDKVVSNQIAYCNYKLSNLDSIGTCTSATLNAQIAYRKYDYERAATLYSNLITEGKEKDVEIVEMLKTNYNAASISFKQPKECKSFEGIFNASLALSSHEVLENAFKVGLEFLKSEGFNDEEIENELSSLYIQKAYNLLVEGKIDESRTLNERILTITSDPQLKAIAINNILSSSPVSSYSEMSKTLKAIKILRAPDVDGKLSLIQRGELMLNSALVFLHSTKNITEAKQILNSWHDFCGASSITNPLADRMEIINAFILMLECKKSVDNPYRDVVVPFLEEKVRLFDGKSVCLPLTLSFIYLWKLKNSEKAFYVISNNSLFYEDVMIDFLVKNKMCCDSLIQIIEKALIKAPTSQHLKEELAFAFIRNGNYKEAISSFERINTSLRVKCGLVMAYSYLDASKAFDLIQSYNIPPISSIKSEAENDFFAFFSKELKLGNSKLDKSQQSGPSKKTRKRSKRKPRVPKTPYDPALRPDPERWISKKLRKNFVKRKKSNKDEHLHKTTQGSLPVFRDGADETSKGLSTSSSHSNHPKKKKGKGKSKW